MLNRLLLPLSTLLFIISFSPLARAQEIRDTEKEHGDVVTLAEKPNPSVWDASAEITFLPSSAMRGAGDDLSMTEVRAGIGRRFPLNSRLELSGGVRYSTQLIDAPASAHLPDALHALSIYLGGEYRTSDSLTLGIRISPGLSSDFNGIGTDDVRVPVSFNARYQRSRTLTLLGGIIFTGGAHAYPVLPILGVLYMPSDRLVFAAGFPRTGVMYRTNGVECYAGVESGRGEYRLHDDSVGAKIISYRDFRAVAGVDMALSRSVKAGFAGGYAFARRFVFYEGSRDDLRIDGVPFGKVQVKIAW
ncbi:hypothetical protein LPW11_01820 [Geomonas sp. RF6]|uniref:hypothetical protein n=1 Tax=Geomonas sp. RF6 TaxID=2897342 RepID=UPI001E6015CE|nr:hypothetical protein [Geomonas sp. RF6]UFS70934.1 hypothetical protein LPW11_01820 [Geomonas sp. RF6]